MFSPVKAITLGTLIFATGGMLLISQPFEQVGNGPGAEAEAVAPTWITGTVEPASSCDFGDTELDGEVTRYRNVECSPQRWISSDPRFSGEVARRWNQDVHRTDEGDVEVGMDAAFLGNDDGGWACTASYVAAGSDMEEVTDTTYTCTGAGGYVGLSAIVVSAASTGNSEEFVGLIFSGGFPPLPEPPADE